MAPPSQPPGAVSGITDTAVSRTIASLLPNTTYHYRVVAQNVNGTASGADMTFTTGAFPTAVTNAASNVLATTATLNGTVNARRNSTTVFFEYGLDTSYGATITAEPGTIIWNRRYGSQPDDSEPAAQHHLSLPGGGSKCQWHYLRRRSHFFDLQHQSLFAACSQRLCFGRRIWWYNALM